MWVKTEQGKALMRMSVNKVIMQAVWRMVQKLKPEQSHDSVVPHWGMFGGSQIPTHCSVPHNSQDKDSTKYQWVNRQSKVEYAYTGVLFTYKK